MPKEDPERRLRRMVREHADLVWRTLRRLGLPSHTAEDGVQRVFMVASRRLPEIVMGAEKAFLVQTAVRVASSERRSFARRQEDFVEAGVVDVADRSPTAEEALDRGRARALLDRVLEDLPLDLRTVFVLSELEEMPAPTVAELLGVPVGTIASRLRRARESFHSAVRRHQRHALAPRARTAR
jgi:RNA polymerase sigma-70 factor, ECF subfamily